MAFIYKVHQKSGEIEIIESHNVKVILFWIKSDLLGSDEAEYLSPTPSPPQSWPNIAFSLGVDAQLGRGFT